MVDHCKFFHFPKAKGDDIILQARSNLVSFVGYLILLNKAINYLHLCHLPLVRH